MADVPPHEQAKNYIEEESAKAQAEHDQRVEEILEESAALDAKIAKADDT